mgnify:CR=1 FL=1
MKGKHGFFVSIFIVRTICWCIYLCITAIVHKISILSPLSFSFPLFSVSISNIVTASAESQTIMFAKQHLLPRLPVPNLQTTLDQYLAFCKTLLTGHPTAALQHTTDVVEAFRTSADAQSLQLALLTASQSADVPNWLTRWWSDLYLTDRASPGINVSPVISFRTPKNVREVYRKLMTQPPLQSDGVSPWSLPPGQELQVSRAAVLAHLASQFRLAIDRRTLEIDSVRGKPMCMLDYDAFFCGVRVPGLGRDTMVSYHPATPGGLPPAEPTVVGSEAADVASKGQTAAQANPSAAPPRPAPRRLLGPKHMLVMARGRLFTVPSLTEAGDPISVSSLQVALSEILRRCGEGGDSGASTSATTGLGFLTALERDYWAKTRGHLIASSARNRRSLHFVESAAFVLTLDDSSPTIDTAAELRHLWYGGDDADVAAMVASSCGTAAGGGVRPFACLDGYVNRWWDKSLHLHVARNGAAGCTFEHSAMDSLPVLRLTKHVLENEAATLASATTPQGAVLPHPVAPAPPGTVATTEMAADGTLSSSFAPCPTVEELIFDVDNALLQAKERGRQTLLQLLSSLDVALVADHDVSGPLLRGLGVSPDACAQLAMQVAFQRLHPGWVPSTYESASTKTFLMGRTETLRITSDQSQHFVHAFCNLLPPEAGAVRSAMSAAAREYDFDASVTPGASLWAVVESLHSAVSRHGTNAGLCSTGHGCDRHMLALFLLSKERMVARASSNNASSAPLPALPDIFSDPTWTLFRNIVLSTSHPISYRGMHSLVGFAPVSAKCVGCGYFMLPAAFTAGITTWRDTTLSPSQTNAREMQSAPPGTASDRFAAELRYTLRAICWALGKVKSAAPNGATGSNDGQQPPRSRL